MSIGGLSGKIWGKTRCIVENPFCEVHVVKANKGGVCSTHHHQYKANVFYIISGSLKITTWKDGLVDEVIIQDGEYTTVKPNDKHRFEALEETNFIEVYYPQGIGQDIVRQDQGFMKSNSPEPKIWKNSILRGDTPTMEFLAEKADHVAYSDNEIPIPQDTVFED